jgi:hypothetical protein
MLIPTSFPFPALNDGSIATSISDPILSILPPPILTLFLHLTLSRYDSSQPPQLKHLIQPAPCSPNGTLGQRRTNASGPPGLITENPSLDNKSTPSDQG